MQQLPGTTCGVRLGASWMDEGTSARTRMPDLYSLAGGPWAAAPPRPTPTEASILAVLDLNGIWNLHERAMFLAQTSAESGGFVRMREDMSRYTVANVEKLWGRYFREPGSAEATVAAGPEAVANRVYGPTHKGLGNTEPGDGARFIGRGFIQITGRHNYTAAARATGLDLVNQPELAEQPANAARIAVWFWKRNHVGAPARQGDVATATFRINGGYNGLARRRKLYVHYLSLLHDDGHASRPGLFACF